MTNWKYAEWRQQVTDLQYVDLEEKVTDWKYVKWQKQNSVHPDLRYWFHWLYALIMLRMCFRVNPHAIVT